jgi:hypothetical protein
LLASEEELKQRAAQWDQPVSEYVLLSERYLGFQQPRSVYAFADAGDGHKRVIVICNLPTVCYFSTVGFQIFVSFINLVCGIIGCIIECNKHIVRASQADLCERASVLRSQPLK